MSGIPAWPCDILVCTTFTIVPLLELHRRQCGHIAISMVMHAQPGADTDGHTHEFPGDSLVVFQEDCAGAGGHVPSAGGANPRAERGARPYKNGEYETAGNRRKQPENAGKRRKTPETRGTKQPENAGQHKGAPAGAPATGSGCDLGSFVDMRHKLLDMADVSGSGDVGYLRAQELGAREGLLLRRRRILGCWGCPKRCWWPAGTATMVLLLESDGVHGCPRHRTFRPTTPIWGHPFGARLAALRCALRAVRCAVRCALCAVRCALRCAAPVGALPLNHDRTATKSWLMFAALPLPLERPSSRFGT